MGRLLFLSVIAGLDPAIQVTFGVAQRNLDHRVLPLSRRLGDDEKRNEA
ncbi:MAG TPA: hypothetical protein VG742_20470 [Dongiaceae bacterium]|nr:hypothetical protein [Dongiaceae bacterium]